MKPSVRDSILYLLIGLAVLCLGAYLGLHPPKRQISSKWIELAIMTAMVFGFMVKVYWGYRHNAKVWLTLSLILLLHISVFSLFLVHYDWHLSFLAKVALPTGEWALLAILMYWILGVIPYSKSR